jgi:hypothetical protein
MGKKNFKQKKGKKEKRKEEKKRHSPLFANST